MHLLCRLNLSTSYFQRKMAAKKRHQNQNTNANSESSNTTRKKVGKKKENKEDNGVSGDLKYKIFIAALGEAFSALLDFVYT